MANNPEQPEVPECVDPEYCNVDEIDDESLTKNGSHHVRTGSVQFDARSSILSVGTSVLSEPVGRAIVGLTFMACCLCVVLAGTLGVVVGFLVINGSSTDSNNDSPSTNVNVNNPPLPPTPGATIITRAPVVVPAVVPTGSGMVAPVPTILTANPSPEPTQAPTPAPTPSPTLSPTSLAPVPPVMAQTPLLQLLSGVSKTFMGNDDAIRLVGSPQHQAYFWLLEEDFTTDEIKLVTRYALAVFYYSLNGDNWINQLNWLQPVDECTWFTSSATAICGALSGSLNTLELANNNLVGTVPPEIGLLTSLTKLILRNNPNNEDIATNSITGSLPTTIGLLNQLQILTISNNRITGGNLPTEIGLLNSLTNVNLNNNQIPGPLPTEMGNLASATVINFSFNAFSGALPTELGQLDKLLQLTLNNNELSGNLDDFTPDILLGMASLRGFFLNNNQLSGTLPTELGLLTTIRNGLGVSGNDLKGKLPIELSQLTLMRRLLLARNSFTGGVPGEYASLAALEEFRIDGNDLSGAVPLALCAGSLSGSTASYADCDEISCTCCSHCCNAAGVCSPQASSGGGGGFGGGF